MRNLAILIFTSILLFSCGKNENMDLDQIQGKWYYFSQQRISTNGEITIDTLDSKDYYFDFRADMSFLSTADGEGFYELSRDSVHINVKSGDADQYERFGFKYSISGNDLALQEGRVIANMKRF